MTPPATAPTATDASTGGAKRPTREPDPAAPPQPLATEVAARLPHRDTAIRGFVTRIMPSTETCVSLTSAPSDSKSFAAPPMSG